MRWMDDCCVDINPLGDNSGGTQSIVIGDTTIPLYYNSMTTIWYNTRPKSAHLSLKRFTLTSPVFFRPFDLVITLSVSWIKRVLDQTYLWKKQLRWMGSSMMGSLIQFRERVRLYGYSGLALVLLRFQGGAHCAHVLFRADETGFSSPLLSTLDSNGERSCIPLPFSSHWQKKRLPAPALQSRSHRGASPSPACMPQVGHPHATQIGWPVFHHRIRHTSARAPWARALS